MTVNYSPTEQALIDLLQVAKKPLDVRELVALIYCQKAKPWHAEIVIRSAMKSLVVKAATNGEKFRVERSRVPGQRSHLFRLVRTRNDKPLKNLAK